MKVLFVDVDHVLNDGSGPPQPQQVAQLNDIADRSGAKVVLSSSRRFQHGLPHQLRQAGLSHDIHDRTPELGDGASRGAEIEAWLFHNPGVTNYAVLDDRDDMDNVYSNHVHIPAGFGGLAAQHVDAALKLLE